MPLHSAPTNSEIFAQKARERAREVLALREDEFPGLMRTDSIPPKSTIQARLRKSRTLMIAVGIAVVVVIATSAATGNNSTASNTLRNSNDKNNSADLEDSEGAFSQENEEEGTSTLSPFDFADDDEFCQDDPDFLYQGNAGQDCAWVAEKHTDSRCDHLKVVEHCRATCDIYCTGTMEPSSIMTGDYLDDNYQEFQNGDDEEEEEPQDDFDPDACMDNPNFRFEGVSTQNCDWVATKFTSFRCSESGVSENCPATCDPDCDYETSTPTSDFDNDGNYEDDNYDEVCGNNPNFRFQGEPDQSCEWVAQKFTPFRCSEAEVSENCPEICNPDCATLPPSFTSTFADTSEELISDEVKIPV